MITYSKMSGFVVNPLDPKSKGGFLNQLWIVKGVKWTRPLSLLNWPKQHKVIVKCVPSKGVQLLSILHWNLFLSLKFRPPLLEWDTSPSKFSGRRQVILWNVGNHWVRSRQVEGKWVQQNKQISVLHPSLISQNWLNRLRIQSADEKCVCLRVCMNWYFYTQDKVQFVFPLNQKGLCHFFFFFFFFCYR